MILRHKLFNKRFIFKKILSSTSYLIFFTIFNKNVLSSFLNNIKNPYDEKEDSNFHCIA